MKTDRRFYRALPVILAGALFFAAASLRGATAQGSFDRTLKVSGPVELEVDTGSGYITVRTGDSSDVHVHGIIRAGHFGWFGGPPGNAEAKVHQLEKNPPILQSGNLIRIGRIEDPALRHNISISYELDVPPETRLKAATGSGNVSVEGIHGPVKATTGSGGLKISDIGNDLVATTGSGDVTVSSIHGGVHLNTGSGSIQAMGISGPFFVGTGSGDIKLKEMNDGGSGQNGFTGGKVSTGSGSIELSGVNGSLRVGTGSGNISAQGSPAGDWTLHTGSGTITLQLPAHASFDLDAHTDSGSVASRLPLTMQGTVKRGTLQGKVGNGGPRLELRAGSGNIQID